MQYTPLSLLYKLAYASLRVYWFLFRPQLYGVKCLIEFDGRILMIRNTYGDMHWTFPGGGFKRNETPEMAAMREVSEEVGISLSVLRPLGEYTSRDEFKRDTVKCYAGRVTTPDFEIERNEIYEAAWFAWAELPQPLASDARRVIELYRNAEGRSAE
ncbi:MAG: NUDIX domain-containing protein [Pyrinomonadaceae bacterium]|nr:NUDIX domain-containing protein [Pyrinomonadaceae bacterium]